MHLRRTILSLFCISRAIWDKKHVYAGILSIFDANDVLNGYVLVGQMKPAQNSDSRTQIKKLNPTSRTKIRRKLLKYLFFRDTLYVFAVLAS